MGYDYSQNVSYKGMNLDSSPFGVEEGEYTFALNAVLNSLSNNLFVISNARSNERVFLYPQGFYETGKIVTNNLNEYFIFLVHEDGIQWKLELINFEKGTSITYATEANINLGLKVTHRIEGEFKETGDCSRYIYFTDNLNKIRYLNVTNPYGNTIIEQTSTLIFPNYYQTNPVCIDLISTPDEGSLKSGAYQVQLQYADANGVPRTGLIGLTGIISIHQGNLSSGWTNIEGSNPDVPTSKSININILNLNTEFDYYNLIILQTINGITTPYIVGTFTIDTNSYNITGFENWKSITLEEAFYIPKFYDRAKTVTQSNNYLIFGNLNAFDGPNLQRLVTKWIYLFWKDYGIKYDDIQKNFKNPINSAINKNFMRDEVYAFGISFTLKNGQETAVFHIPGRKKSFSNKIEKLFVGNTVVPNPDPINNFLPAPDIFGNPISSPNWDTFTIPSTDGDNLLGQNAPRYEVYNTATVISDTGNSIGCKQTGDFSYQECDIEYPEIRDCTGLLVYPQGKIRHHKFPDCFISPLITEKVKVTDYTFLTNKTARETDTNTDVYAMYNVFFRNILDPNPKDLTDVIVNLLGVELPDEAFQNLLNDPDINLYINPSNPIIGWNLYYSNRDADKTILAKGQIYNCRLDTAIDSDFNIQNTFPNYPFNFIPEIADEGGISLVDINYKFDFGISKEYTKDHFNLFSPDTSIKISNVVAGSTLKIEQLNAGFANIQPTIAKDAIERVDSSLLQGNSWVVDCFKLSGGHYNTKYTNTNYAVFKNNINFNLNSSFQYINNLESPVQGINTTYNFDNRNRVPTTYFKTDRNVKNPKEIDTNYQESLIDAFISSGYSGDPSIPDPYDNITNTQGVTTLTSTNDGYLGVISCFYGAIKTSNRNPYSQLSSVVYNKINKQCNEDCILLGGDTFITFYTFKKKHNYFTQYTNEDLAFTYLDYEAHKGTCTFATYNSNGNLKATDGNYYKDSNTKERHVVAYHSVAGFFCESSVNTELRKQGEVEDYQKIYPVTGLYNFLNLSWVKYNNTWWTYNNYWGYNFDYSKQFDNYPYFILTNLQLSQCTFCENTYAQRAIYSLRTSNEELSDSWLTFPANNYYDFPKKSGEIWSLKTYGQDKLFIRTTNSSYIQPAYQTLETNETNVVIGNGSMFSPEPREIITVDNGFLGTKSQWAYNNTPYGSFMVDWQRGNIYSFEGNSPTNIASNKISLWAKNNLRLELLDYYPDFPHIDNPSYYVGYTSGWDNFYNIWYLTKKDFIPKIVDNNNNVLDIQWNGSNFIEKNSNKEIKFGDKDYFINKSFTIGFSPLTKRFISFYSFLPYDYFSLNNSIYTSIGNSIWGHTSKSSYTNFYGNNYSYILELVLKLNESLKGTKRSVMWSTNAYENLPNNTIPYEHQFSTFDQAILYNNEQCTGLLNLKYYNPLNLNQSFSSQILSNSIDVQLEKSEDNTNMFKLSDIWDRVKNRTIVNPIFTDDPYSTDYQQSYPIDKILNNNAIDYNKEWYNLKRLDNWAKLRLFYNNNNYNLINNIILSTNKKERM